MALPDIPREIWTAFQQTRFDELTSGVLDAFEFDITSGDMLREALPPDWPFPGGVDPLQEQQRLAEEEARRQEEERIRQAELQQRRAMEMDAQAAQATQENMLAPEQSYGFTPAEAPVAADVAVAEPPLPMTGDDFMAWSGNLLGRALPQSTEPVGGYTDPLAAGVSPAQDAALPSTGDEFNAWSQGVLDSARDLTAPPPAPILTPEQQAAQDFSLESAGIRPEQVEANPRGLLGLPSPGAALAGAAKTYVTDPLNVEADRLRELDQAAEVRPLTPEEESERSRLVIGQMDISGAGAVKRAAPKLVSAIMRELPDVADSDVARRILKEAGVTAREIVETGLDRVFDAARDAGRTISKTDLLSLVGRQADEVVETAVRPLDEAIDLTPPGVADEVVPVRMGVDPLKTQTASSVVGGTAGALYEGEEEDEETSAEERARNAGIGMVAGALFRRSRPKAPFTPGAAPDPGLRKINRQYGQPVTRTPGMAAPDAIENLRRKFVRAWTDENVDIRILQEEVAEKIGRPLVADEMIELQLRLNPNGSAAQRISEGLRPVLQNFNRKDYEWLREYLTLLDNDDVIKATGNQSRQFAGNISVAENAASLNYIRTQLDPAFVKQLDDATTQIRSFVDDYRIRMKDAGIWSDELHTDLTTMYPNYIPTRILDYMKGIEGAGFGAPKTISLSDRQLRRLSLEGSPRAREDPINALVRYAHEAEGMIRKNNAFNALVDLRGASPDLQTLIRPVAVDHTPKRGEKLIQGWLNGEKAAFVTQDALAEVLNFERRPGGFEVLRPVTEAFRELITRFPTFLAGQIPLDAVSYTIREAGRSGGPEAVPGAFFDLLKGYVDAFRGLRSGTFHGSTADYLREGGAMAGLYQRGVEANSRSVDKLLRKNIFEINSRRDLWDALTFSVGFGWSQKIGERIELAPRVASFNRAQRRAQKLQRAGQRPADVRESVVQGRDVTLDFARGGTFARALNSAIPFFNVGWQAASTIPRAYKENPVGFSLTAAATMGAPLIVAEAWNRSDEQRSRDYDDVPQYIKDRGIVFMLPGEATDEQGNRRPQFFTIPTRELSPLIILGREMLQMGREGYTPRDWEDLLSGVLGAASPVQASGPEDLFSTLNPIGVATAAQLASGRDVFRQRTIATERSDEDASNISKAIAERLVNSGIRAFQNVRPSQIEFAIRDLGGGFAKGGLGLGDIVTGRAQKSERLADTPVVGGIASRYIGDQIGNELTEAREAALPSSVQKAASVAGLRPNQITGVSDTIQNVKLRREEQARYQRLFNSYLAEEVSTAKMSQDWITGKREAAFRAAADRARKRAADEVYRDIPPESRMQRKAGT